MSENLQELLNRIKSDTYSQEDIQNLRFAIQNGLVKIEGDRAIGIGGDAKYCIFITGDNNKVSYSLPSEIVEAIILSRKTPLVILDTRWRISIIVVAMIASLFPQIQAFAIDIEQSVVSLVRGLSLPPSDSFGRGSESNLLIVHINEESLIIDKIGQRNPIDRDYLAKIIKQLIVKKAKYIAVNYILDKSTGNSDKNLGKIIRDAINNNKVQFLFGSAIEVKDGNDQEIGIGSNIDIGSVYQSVSGFKDLKCSGDYSAHCIGKWDRRTDKVVSFSYLLAMMQERSQKQSTEKWDKDSIKNSQISSLVNPLPWLTSLKIDYSQLPDTIYERITAQELLHNSTSLDLSNKIVLVADGVYKKTNVDSHNNDKDYSRLPLAVWLHSSALKTDVRSEYFTNNRPFTESEIQAYIANQMLTKSLIIRVADTIAIVISLIVLTSVRAATRFHSQKNVFKIYSLTISLFAYIPVCLLFYLILNIAIPFILPISTILLAYTLPVYWNKKCLNSEN
jgi:CHASE2 domain